MTNRPFRPSSVSVFAAGHEETRGEAANRQVDHVTVHEAPWSDQCVGALALGVFNGHLDQILFVDSNRDLFFQKMWQNHCKSTVDLQPAEYRHMTCMAG